LTCRKNRGYRICKDCVRAQNNKSYFLHKVERSKSDKIKRQNIKATVLEHYGSKCKLCGETNTSLLSLDHIDGNGRQHRLEVLGTDSGSGFYKWVFKNWPSNLRILCFNCNCQHNISINELEIQYDTPNTCKYCGNQDNIRLGRICRECERVKKRNARTKLKLDTLIYYGGCCVECGTDNLSFLTIDHINNNGGAHRKEIGPNIYEWLKKNNYPLEGFQVLCFNCNYSKHFKQLDAA